MKDKLSGFTRRDAGLVQNRDDGLVSIFSNPATRYKKLIEPVDICALREGDEITVVSSRRGSPVWTQKFRKGTPRQQLETYRQKRTESGEEYDLVGGEMRVLKDGVEVAPRTRVNIFIARKSGS